MKIVALDTQALSFDGLSWDSFNSLGQFTSYPSSTQEQGHKRAEDATAVIVNKYLVNEEFLRNAPALKFVGVTATGVNNIDLEACKKRAITVTNVPAYSSMSVAQLVFSYITFHYSRLADYFKLSKNWSSSAKFSMPLEGHRELSSLKICILGLGSIGEKVEQIAKAFEMDILIPALPKRNYQESRPSIEDCLAVADIVSLHCPLNENTREIINKASLDLMKKDSILINTGRGPLVNESDLANALGNKQISAAYLDVLAIEPPVKDNPLFDKAFITPHIAWTSIQARTRLLESAFLNLDSFVKGELRNVV